MSGAKRTRRRGTTARQRAWLESVTAQIARMAALRKAASVLRTLPCCGAYARSTGQPCRKPGLANGRCAIHGGRTPAGQDWHIPQLTNPSRSVEKAVTKVRTLARRRKQQAEKLATMTLEERERHDQWHATHKPGSLTVRQRARHDREARELFANLNATQKPTSSEAAALEGAIRKLKARIAQLEARQPDKTTSHNNGGNNER